MNHEKNGNDEIHDLIRKADRAYEFSCHSDAFQLYKRIEKITIEQGHVNFRLGVIYHNGWGVTKDEEKAKEYFALAVSQLSCHSEDDAEAQCDLGYMYENGFGVPKDQTKGFHYYQRSAELGFPTAQFNCGYMHHYGHGTRANHQLALQYYQHAADSGYPLGQYNLGFMYHHGCGTPMDPKLTLKYYKMSADQGYPRALYIMGYLYYAGIGVPKDKQEELKYYRLAAERGHSRAGFELAKMYESGNGVPQSFKMAVQYLLNASFVFVDNKDAQASLTQVFSGDVGEEYKQTAITYLAESFPKYHQLLHPGCLKAILELFYTMKNLCTPTPIEWIWLIVPSLIKIWPDPHFDHIKNK